MPQILKKTIKKVAIAKGRTLQVQLTESVDDGTFRDVVMKCDQLYHADMETQIERLKPFLADICDQRERDLLADLNDVDNDCLENYEVTAVSISGSTEAEGVVISGTRRIGDSVLKLESPMVELSEEYNHAELLGEIIEAIRFEASEYLFNGKYAIKQQELPFPEEKDEFAVDKEANEVASGVLEQIGENILKDLGADSVKITASGKRGKKDKVIMMTQSAATAESF
jgi:hypothetical protein